MKKRIKIVLIVTTIILLSISCIYFIGLKARTVDNKDESSILIEESDKEVNLFNIIENKKEEQLIKIEDNNQHEDLINIEECSEEFMEKYFEETKEINENSNKDNILIVTSKDKLENTYGASDIIQAPNNQYFIQYNSEEEKKEALEKLKNSEDIVYVEENHVYSLFESDYNSWGIEKMGLDSAIKIAEENNNLNDSLKEVTVAIIDTGCDMELFNENYPGKISETYNLYDGSEMYDDNGHGTHIAGTIAEGTSSNVNILPIKVSNSKTLDLITVLTAVNYINYYEKADVINMSFGAYSFDNSLYVAIESAAKNGIISVAASGNESTSTNCYPAAFDNTISVSAVDSNLNFAQFSNYGEMVTFTAPGVRIKSINGYMSGTSMAAPHVVCAVAMLKSTNESLSVEEIITLLKNTAIDLGESGWDKYYGHGLIDLSNFDDLILQSENTDIVDFGVENTSDISAIYGNITNLMNLKMRLKDANGNEYIRKFSEIDNLKIENYDAFAIGEQEIKIKYNNIEKTITVNNGESGGDTSAYVCYYVDEAQSTVSVKVNDSNMPKKIYIPEYIDNYKVVQIYEGAFKNAEINEIILPSTVTSIGNEAFVNSTIKSLTGGASEISIGDYAFYNAYKLEVCEPKIADLGVMAFCYATSINNLVLSDNMKIIENYAFTYCDSLENINIPNNLVEIRYGAFAGTKIKNLSIPKTLVKISEDVFLGVTGLETIEVDAENSIYDSRENCNALIQTSSNAIILGASCTTIPDTVITIEAYAFCNNNKIEKINTNKVKTINEYAFYGCSNLKEFYLTDTVETLGNYALYYVPNITVYMYNTKFQSDLYSGKNQVNRAICIIPAEINALSSKEYIAFDKVKDIEINISYYGFGPSEFSLEEVITDSYTISYENGGDCFKYGDTYFTVSAVTQYGITIEKQIDVVIKKAKPEYEIPTNITAKEGTKLSEISLPSGFEWMDENEIVEGSESVAYKARYIPTDTANYEIIENIEIIITIKNEIINNSCDYEGIYDGNEHSIIINIDVTDYDIKYSIDNQNYDLTILPTFKEVGEYTVYYKITKEGYQDIISSNKVKIYGIKDFDSTLELRNNILIVKDYNNSFQSLSSRINTLSTSCTCQHFDKEGNLIDRDEIITGDSIKININNLKDFEYKISVLGDVNCDGKITALDYVKIKNHIMKTILINTDLQLIATDVNDDGKISALDYVRVKNHIMNGGA